MTDFYTLAKQLRAALLALYPNGYIKTVETETSVTITIKNFSNENLYIHSLQLIK